MLFCKQSNVSDINQLISIFVEKIFEKVCLNNSIESKQNPKKCTDVYFRNGGNYFNVLSGKLLVNARQHLLDVSVIPNNTYNFGLVTNYYLILDQRSRDRQVDVYGDMETRNASYCHKLLNRKLLLIITHLKDFLCSNFFSSFTSEITHFKLLIFLFILQQNKNIFFIVINYIIKKLLYKLFFLKYIFEQLSWV